MKEVTAKEKAERYDALQAAIEFHKNRFSINRSYANERSEERGGIGDFYRGKKYAYDEMVSRKYLLEEYDRQRKAKQKIGECRRKEERDGRL